MRALPAGLAARILTLLAAALVAVLLLALVLLAVQREVGGRDARIAGALARIAALVPVIEAAPPGQRAALLRDASSRGARLELRTAPPAIATAPGTRALARQVAAALPGREIRLGDLPRGGVLIAIAISGPDAWLVTALSDRPPRADLASLLPWLLVLSVAVVLGTGLVIARQITRPLGALEAAALAAGGGDRSARAPERGPREIVQAARAFNTMQARIAREQQERARILGSLGHDLRTPITGLRIRAELLPDADGAPMIAALDEMAAMADGLLAEARGEATPEPVGVTDLAALLRALAEERGAGLGPLAPVQARLRPLSVRRATGNLIDNALRYAGHATVSLVRDAGVAVILVDDTGPGIPTAQLDDVTQPFVRGETSRNADTVASGLGLSIARTIAEAHGGSLRLVNRPGGGLRAEIRLPCEPAASMS